MPQSSNSVANQAARQLSTNDTVFETLLRDIVSGKYPAHTRLPAERELSKELGASRPTLREALRRLAQWKLVIARWGSGIVVQPNSDWSLDVLPAFMRYSTPDKNTPSDAEILADLMLLRRGLMREILRIVASRFSETTAQDARTAAMEAWELRHDSTKFVTADLEVLRAMVASANFLPGLWMLNQLRSIYIDMARTLGDVLPPPDSRYLSVWNEVLDACEQQEGARAVDAMETYLCEHDSRLLAILGHNL
ncbi:MAG: FadR family transcriptional regulator [Kofleriaceae bacterium]|nr:FadR family transcriptional regulator [Kofleriaceae bacterium]